MYDFIVGTDGLCKNNQAQGGQPGAWAFVVFKGTKKVGHRKGVRPETTNQEMELYACLEALRWASKHNIRIKILTDSKYVERGFNEWITGCKKNNWKTSKNERVKYADFWKEAEKLLQETDSLVEWVKGHSGVRENEAADMYCNEAYFNKYM